MMLYPHLVFGYGSLICPESRAITAPTVADRTALPVSIEGVARTWAKQSKKMKATSMGVSFQEGSSCVGVLVPVNDVELEQFDRREVGYDRHAIELKDIQRVSHLLEESDLEVYHDTFLDPAYSSDKESMPQVWIYVQQNPIPASPQYPIAQSYVDIMLRGCLTISPEFAQEFIQTTKGWDPAELSDDDENDNDRSDYDDNSSIEDDSDDDSSMEQGWWVDDRRDPLYVRADSEYSLRHSKKIDALLKESLDEEKFRTRIRRGKSQVLTQLNNNGPADQ